MMKSFFFYLIKLFGPKLQRMFILKNIITIAATTYLTLAVNAKKFCILLRSTVLQYKYYFVPYQTF